MSEYEFQSTDGINLTVMKHMVPLCDKYIVISFVSFIWNLTSYQVISNFDIYVCVCVCVCVFVCVLAYLESYIYFPNVFQNVK